jgi:predicted RNA binding protein YcfA (HicA-like mRNA interferase family)
MKRRDLLRYLAQHGCIFVREGSDHSIWANPVLKRRSTVPRHREIPNHTANQICKQLGIPAAT